MALCPLLASWLCVHEMNTPSRFSVLGPRHSQVCIRLVLILLNPKENEPPLYLTVLPLLPAESEEERTREHHRLPCGPPHIGP